MIVYFDTSAFVPILVEEPASANASLLWDEAERAVSSRLLYAEARAALALAQRIGRLSNKQLRKSVADLEDLITEVDFVEVTQAVTRRAGELAERLELRGYDAVHLSSAEHLADPDLVLAAGDRPLLRAATALGLATSDVHREQL